MVEKIETIIVGGGQGGLATSYYLKQQGRDHLVVEQAVQAGNVWRNDRWDSFTLLTPNWAFKLPGAEYQGETPDGFMLKEEIVNRFEKYVEQFRLPVQYQVRVTSVERDAESGEYLVKTDTNLFRAKNVVIATGLYQHPKLPAFSADLPKNILQIHSGKYRNPQLLPEGAVLVVGSAQSGCQIAEELYQNGRTVYLCTGSNGRVPRRYRGKDVYEWMSLIGLLDKTVDQLENPKAKFASNPHVSGRDGGHTLNLHKFAQDGVVLLGHMINGSENRLLFKPDRNENLTKSDKFEADLVNQINAYINRSGLEAPIEQLPELNDGFKTEEITELDIGSASISTVIWSMGYNFDFSLVKLPITDGDGYPIQTRGVTNYPGLYFVGLPWLYKARSGHLSGVGQDAEYIASEITGREMSVK